MCRKQETAMPEAPRIYPTFRYHDPAAMMVWLCDTVGFTVHARHPAEGPVAHAELAFGSSMIMLGAVRDDAYGALVGGSGQDGGKSLYLAVDDVDALHDRVLASGVVDRGRPGRPRLWQPRVHLPRSGRQPLVLRHLLAEGGAGLRRSPAFLGSGTTFGPVQNSELSTGPKHLSNR
jgi:uncharacterized glyoxalase superfamily protein PhnB